MRKKQVKVVIAMMILCALLMSPVGTMRVLADNTCPYCHGDYVHPDGGAQG